MSNYKAVINELGSENVMMGIFAGRELIESWYENNVRSGENIRYGQEFMRAVIEHLPLVIDGIKFESRR